MTAINNNSNLSETEKRLETTPAKGSIEKAFDQAVETIQKRLEKSLNKIASNVMSDDKKKAILWLIEDIQDTDNTTLEDDRINKIKSVLSDKNVPNDIKEQIAWLYGYAREINDLESSYKAELWALVTWISTEITSLFANFPENNAKKISSKFKEVKAEGVILPNGIDVNKIWDALSETIYDVTALDSKRNIAFHELQNLANSMRGLEKSKYDGILRRAKDADSKKEQTTKTFTSNAPREARSTAKIVSDFLQKEIDEETDYATKQTKIKKLETFTSGLSTVSDLYKQNMDFVSEAKVNVEKYDEIDSWIAELNVLKKDPSWGKIFKVIKKTYNIDEKDFSILTTAAKHVNLTDIFSIVGTSGSKAFDKKFPEGYNRTGDWWGPFRSELGMARAAAKVYEKYTTKNSDATANNNVQKFLNQVRPILENNDVTNSKVLWEQIARLTTVTNSAEKVKTDKKLAYMLWDIDANGKVNKEDGATIAWLALSNMYENAKAQLSEAEVVQNILAFMNMGKEKDKIITLASTEAALMNYLISNPAELQSLRNKLFLMGEEAILIFKKGQKTGEIATSRYIDKEAFSGALDEKEISKLIDKKMWKWYSELLAKLQELAKDPATKSAEAKKYQDLIDDLKKNEIENLKNIKLEAIWIGTMFLKNQYLLASAAGQLTNKTLNEWLSENTKGLLENLSFVPGVAHLGHKKFWVALGINLWWDKQWWEIMTHGDRSASWNFFSAVNVGPRFTFGVGGRYWREWQVNANQIRENFEQTTAKYINAWISAYYSVDGAHVAWDVGYRRDQLRGIEQKGEVIRVDVDLQKLIQEILKKWSTKKEEVLESLKNVFPKTKRTAWMEAFAQKIMNAVGAFKWVDKLSDPKVAENVAKSIAENLARSYNNEQVQGMAKVQFSGTRMIVDFPVRPGAPVDLAIETVLLSVFSSVGFTKYWNTKWLEDLESVQQASDILASGAWLDENNEIGSRSEQTAITYLNSIAKSIQRKENATTTRFSKDNINGAPYILIDKVAFEKMNFAILPVLKQYVWIYENKVAIPALPWVYTELAKSTSLIRTLVFGSVGTGNTEQLMLSDIPDVLPAFDKSILVTPHAVAETIKFLQEEDQLLAPLKDKNIIIDEKNGTVKITEKGEPVKFDWLKGVLKFSELNGDVSVKLDTTANLATEPLKIEYVTQKIMDIELGQPNAEWQSYLDKPEVEAKIIQLKNHGWTPAQKAAYIQYKTAKQTNNPKAAIDAVKKMWFNPNELENQDQSISIANLNYLSGKFALTSATWSKDTSSDNYDKFINTDNNKLRGTLSRERQSKLRDVPLTDLTTARRKWGTYQWLGVNSLQKLIAKEEYLSNWKASFENARKITVSMIWQDALYGSKESKNAIALVFGYGTSWVEENFTGHPKLATKKDGGGLYETSVNDTNLKKYFLENMGTKTNYFDQLAIAIAEQYNAGLAKTDQVDAKSITPELIKNALLAQDDAGRIITIDDKTIPIWAEFSFAFYAECFNESLVMKNLTVTKETKSDVKIEDKVYENLANTTQTATRNQIGINAWVWRVINKGPKSETHTDQLEITSETTTWQVVKNENGDRVFTNGKEEYPLMQQNWKLYLNQGGNQVFVADVPNEVVDIFGSTQQTTEVSITITKKPVNDILENTMKIETTEWYWEIPIYLLTNGYYATDSRKPKYTQKNETDKTD